MSVIVLVLVGVLLLVVGGCVCVVWASRGGPRWVRGVAAVTLGVGQLVRKSGRSGRSSNSGSDWGSGAGAGSGD
ncbi:MULTISPECIES: hypothetical protein [unclassified Streptomyces]|uniref:hypothetical protein n=1 Tax=Streptomyces sp. cf386 TaxID=1761904 RepID=UPI000892245F|nr:hypothetical protein [Streptomyces sp. cf386]SDO34184.1 hypothetical protein SAMN04487981_11046 [Streptomyces sp. cf386]